jgi:Glycosyl transferases group 1
MKFTIITHVSHKEAADGGYAAYGPYVKEMNLWFKHVGDVLVVAPFDGGRPDKIDLPYSKAIIAVPVAEINLTNTKSMLRSLLALPSIFWKVYLTMRKADHIHLRCPGNMGLVGCLVQMLFPGKPKSAKYAGNWDAASGQPFTYRLQRKILNNPFLTRNMKVLVYGSWPDSSKNIVPFFTASYNEVLKLPVADKGAMVEPIKLVFVGALSEGKRPMLSINIAEELGRRGHRVQLDILGNGTMMEELKAYVALHKLESQIVLHGNKPADEILKYYREAHFLIFLSKSEGWPKVVAEAMWWGCLPITTAVSCVPEMVGHGTRGSLIAPDLAAAADAVEAYIADKAAYRTKTADAMAWSRQFTLEKFESAIAGILS